MENKEDNLNDVIARLESRALKLEPSRQSWQTLVDRLSVTEEVENRLNKQKVNIISPFYRFMSNTGKVLSALALVAVFAIGGVVYYQMAVPVSEEVGTLATNLNLPIKGQVADDTSITSIGGGEPITGLLTLINEELNAEDKLLAGESISAYGLEEDQLLADLNKYGNEI